MKKLEQIQEVKEIIKSQEAFIKQSEELIGELNLLLDRLETQQVKNMDAGGLIVYMPSNQLAD